MNLNRKRGVAQLFVVAVMAFLALGLPLTTKLVQQNQENRSKAAEDVIRFAKKTTTIDVIDGVCGSKNGELIDHPPNGTEACQVGSIEFEDKTASDGQYDWYCNGSNGGEFDECYALVGGGPVPVCGTANGKTLDHFPTETEACKSGSLYIYSDTKGKYGHYVWRCVGIYENDNVDCSAGRVGFIYAVCGSKNGQVIDRPPNGSEACKVGRMEVIDDITQNRVYQWKCRGDEDNFVNCRAVYEAPLIPTSIPTIIPTKTPTPKPKTCSYGGTTYTIGKAICQGSRPAECLSTGSWKLFTACKYGCTGSGICKTAPTPTPKPKTCSYGGTTYTIGKAICQGSRPAECLSTGSWKLLTACKYGCTGSGICKTAPTPTPKPVCSAGARVCSGSSLKICQNNTWQVVTNCQYGCLNGSCKAAPTPTKRPTATPTRRPTATPKPVAVNGRCGYSRNSCSSGSFVDTADTRTSYLWRCVGKNGGTSVSCSSRKPASTNTLN